MAKNMTLLWHSGSAPCWRVLIALEEKNLRGYNQQRLSIYKMQHRSQEVLEINPRGQLPAFKHGNLLLNESYAACFYLESQFRKQGNKLMPDCPAELAMMYQRMFEGITLYHKIRCLIYYPRKNPEDEQENNAVRIMEKALREEVNLWEGYMKKEPKPFLTGQTFSLSDVTVYPAMALLFYAGLPLERYPKLGEYYTHLKGWPSIKTTWPQNWLKNPEGHHLLKHI
uniref:glutathione S-transferase A-like n=1 Tax=Doryrhamphus excisus TaxID=161450 RepID=UPI0025ADF454|nr:glutathione S-transferase A-like [Doryrhamphus excisus]